MDKIPEDTGYIFLTKPEHLDYINKQPSRCDRCYQTHPLPCFKITKGMARYYCEPCGNILVNKKPWNIFY